jgi:hypothetical protein
MNTDFRKVDRGSIVSYSLLALLLIFGIYRAVIGDYDWAFFAFLSSVIVAAPSLVEGDLNAIVPPELLALTSAPYLVSILGGASRSVVEFSAFVAIVSLGMIITSELHLFTDVKMTRRFSGFFVLIASSAMASVWSVAQFYSDLWLNTQLLIFKGEMMWDIIFATVIGAAGGFIYQHYLKYRDIAGSMRGDSQ